MNTRIIIHPDNKEQLRTLKVFMKALKIPFEVEKSNYDPEFVKKIQKSRKEVENGQLRTVDINAL